MRGRELHPLLGRFVQVVEEHRAVLELPGSPTGRLTALWAKIMVFPQTLAPLLIAVGAPVGDVLLIFAARFVAMHVVWLLDRYMPCTRALGLCHLVTFGPLFAWFSADLAGVLASWGGLGPVFLFYYAVIGACLFMDARDLVLHMAGQPFPAYVRDHCRNGLLQIEDARARAPVTATIFNWLPGSEAERPPPERIRSLRSWREHGKANTSGSSHGKRRTNSKNSSPKFWLRHWSSRMIRRSGNPSPRVLAAILIPKAPLGSTSNTGIVPVPASRRKLGRF